MFKNSFTKNFFWGKIGTYWDTKVWCVNVSPLWINAMFSHLDTFQNKPQVFEVLFWYAEWFILTLKFGRYSLNSLRLNLRYPRLSKLNPKIDATCISTSTYLISVRFCKMWKSLWIQLYTSYIGQPFLRWSPEYLVVLITNQITFEGKKANSLTPLTKIKDYYPVANIIRLKTSW